MVDGSTTRNPLVADYSEWKARDYFQTYYSEVVLPDEQAVLAYQIDVLRAARARFGRGLEYGCGPTHASRHRRVEVRVPHRHGGLAGGQPRRSA